MKKKLFKRFIFSILFVATIFGSTVFASGSWVQNNRIWNLVNEQGTKLTGWQSYNGHWYYLNSDGAMVTGWKQIGFNWYYLNENGDMAIGWKQVGSKWYYLNPNGDMAFNTTIQGYTLDASGAWINTSNTITSDKAEQLVRQYLINNSLYVPSAIQYDHDEGNFYVIHCYDIVVDHTATSGWYYVDKTTGNIKSMF